MAISEKAVTDYQKQLEETLSTVRSITRVADNDPLAQKAALTSIANKNMIENQAYLENIKGTLDTQIDKYVSLSHRLNDYNEIYNTNKYIKKELATHNRDMDSLTSNLRNKIYISKQSSQIQSYETNKLRFWRGWFLFSAFVILALCTVAGAHMQGNISENVFYAILGVVAILYLTIFIVMATANAYRSHLDWYKYYWASMNKDNEGGCK
jgi:lipopolysaccharide export LptBFGC system permease protein LptF